MESRFPIEIDIWALFLESARLTWLFAKPILTVAWPYLLLLLGTLLMIRISLLIFRRF